MKTLLILFLAIITITTSANSGDYYMCFTSDTNPDLGFSIVFLKSNERAYALLYKGKSEYIPLEYKKTVYAKGSAAHTEVYGEKYAGKVTGTYELEYNGNWVYVSYKRKKDGKTFAFTIDLEMSTQDGDPYRTTPCF
jgi:hypothetical protein